MERALIQVKRADRRGAAEPNAQARGITPTAGDRNANSNTNRDNTP
jgi:hypothetical protein